MENERPKPPFKNYAIFMILAIGLIGITSVVGNAMALPQSTSQIKSKMMQETGTTRLMAGTLIPQHSGHYCIHGSLG